MSGTMLIEFISKVFQFYYFFPFPAYQIEARHTFLDTLLTAKPEETESLETVRTLVITITTCLLVFSLMEAAFYFLFSTVVHAYYDMDIILTKIF